jgi:hypothetical protein
METYYVHSADPVVLQFIANMARQKKAQVVLQFPAGYVPLSADSLLIYDKYLNRFHQINGKSKIIEYVREQQFKIPLW